MTVIELYGILDPVTRDWTDGVLSNIFREINKPTEKKEKRCFLLVCLIAFSTFRCFLFSKCLKAVFYFSLIYVIC